MELPPQNRCWPRGLSPETHFIEPAAGCVSGGDRSHIAARTCPFRSAISRGPAPDFTARGRVATGLPGFGDHRREALSCTALSSKTLSAAFHLSLPKLPARFPSRAQDQTRCRMSRLLPGTQRRRIRSAISVETDKIVAAFVSNAALRVGAWHKRPYNSLSSPFVFFSPRNFAWINMSMSPSITACTLLVSAPVLWSFTI